jgi:hypothetical protein
MYRPTGICIFNWGCPDRQALCLWTADSHGRTGPFLPQLFPPALKEMAFQDSDPAFCSHFTHDLSPVPVRPGHSSSVLHF